MLPLSGATFWFVNRAAPTELLSDTARHPKDTVLYEGSRNDDGSLIRLAGIMGVVVAGGHVAIGDAIEVSLPPPPLRPLERV